MQHMKMKLPSLLATLAFASTPALAGVEHEPGIKLFIDEIVAKHNFQKDELTQLFAKVERVPDIIDKMNKPAEGMPWHRYQKIFMQPERIQKGLAFWQKNQDALARAQQKYGVPAEMILGIIGVETRFGEAPGKYRVIDALTTLTLDFPKRSAFFRKELEQFLVLGREENIDPLTVIGSYAGAIGQPQFMPSSYRAYAVDFSGDGVRDLMNNSDDAIGSVASYLSRHGWKADGPVTKKIDVAHEEVGKLAKKGLKPSVAIADLKKYGLALEEHQATATFKTAVIELENETGLEYWLGFDNFYAITRYNQSALYAMAVYQLGTAIAAERLKLSQNN